MAGTFVDAVSPAFGHGLNTLQNGTAVGVNLRHDEIRSRKSVVVLRICGGGLNKLIYDFAGCLGRNRKACKRVVDRFVFEKMKGHPAYQCLYLFCPPCPYPILA